MALINFIVKIKNNNNEISIIIYMNIIEIIVYLYKFYELDYRVALEVTRQ